MFIDNKSNRVSTAYNTDVAVTLQQTAMLLVQQKNAEQIKNLIDQEIKRAYQDVRQQVTQEKSPVSTRSFSR